MAYTHVCVEWLIPGQFFLFWAAVSRSCSQSTSTICVMPFLNVAAWPVKFAVKYSSSVIRRGRHWPIFCSYSLLSRRGYRKPSITIPILPIAVVVRVAEGLGLALPITTENLKGLSKNERMDTSRDMALVGAPIRPLEIILRDNLEHDQALLREAALIARYLLGIALGSELQIRYAKAIERLKIQLDQEELRLWRIIERHPKTLRMIDGGLAIIKPHGGIRRKIYTMLAILETSPEHCSRFLPKTWTVFDAFKFIAIGASAGVTTFLGLILIQMMKVRRIDA